MENGAVLQSGGTYGKKFSRVRFKQCLRKRWNLEARYMTFEELLKSREKDGIAVGNLLLKLHL